MIINDYHSFKDIMAQVTSITSSPEGKENSKQFYERQRLIRKEKETIKNLLYSSLPKSISSRKLITIDFEYDQNKNHLIFECGITKYFNGELQYEHYLIEENYKNKKIMNYNCNLNLDNLEVVTTENLLVILDNLLTETDCLIGHCVFSEYLVLKHHGLDILNINS